MSVGLRQTFEMRIFVFIFFALASSSSLSAQTLWGGYLMNMQSKNNDSVSVFNANTIRTFSLGNGFTQFTGPTTSFKTFTLPNASSTILTSNAAVTIAQGGTGTGSTLTGLLLGSSSAFTAITSTTAGQILRCTGSNTFAFGALDLADADAVTGVLPFANGGQDIVSGRATGQTAANSSVATLTVGGSDASYVVSGNILVTTSGSEAFNLLVDWTDEGNTARSAPIALSRIATGALTAATSSGFGAVPYPSISLQIRCKASTAITIKTSGTFTGCTYNVEGRIAKI